MRGVLGWLGRRPLPGQITDAMLASKLIKSAAMPAQNGISSAELFVDGDTATITNGLAGDALITEIYEFDDNAATTPGNIPVDISVDPTWEALVAAVNANSVLARAAYGSGDVTMCVKLIALTGGTAGNAYTLACSAHGVRDAATFAGGLDSAVKSTVFIAHTVLAIEETEGLAKIGLPFDATGVIVTYRTAAGARVSDMIVDTTTADIVVVSEGATAWTAGDQIIIYAEGDAA
jgi:hypothetical protein